MDKISPFILRISENKQDLVKSICTSCWSPYKNLSLLWKQAKEDWRLISLENLKKDLVTIKDCDKNSLRAQIDYLRLTFPRLKDLDAFCENFLHCHLSRIYRTKKPVSWIILNLWQRGKHLDFDFFDKSVTNDYQTFVFNYLVKDAVSWNCF